MVKSYLSPKVAFDEEVLMSNRPNTAPIVCILGTAPTGPTEFTYIPNLKTLLDTYGTPTKLDKGLNAAAYLLQNECQVLYSRLVPKGAKKSSAFNYGKNQRDFPFIVTWKIGADNYRKKSVTFADENTYLYEFKLGFVNAEKTTVKLGVFRTDVVNGGNRSVIEEIEINSVDDTTPVPIASNSALATLLNNADTNKYFTFTVTGSTASHANSVSGNYTLAADAFYEAMYTDDSTRYYTISAEVDDSKADSTEWTVSPCEDFGIYTFPYKFEWKSYGVEPDADPFINKDAYYIQVGYVGNNKHKGSSESWSSYALRRSKLTYRLCSKQGKVLESFSNLKFEAFKGSNYDDEDYSDNEVCKYINEHSKFVVCSRIPEQPTIDASHYGGVVPNVFNNYISDTIIQFAGGSLGDYDAKIDWQYADFSSLSDPYCMTAYPDSVSSDTARSYKAISDVPINNGLVYSEASQSIPSYFAGVPKRVDALDDVDSLVYDFILIPGLIEPMLQYFVVKKVDERGDALFFPDIAQGYSLENTIKLVNSVLYDDGENAQIYDSRRVAVYYPDATIRSNLTGRVLDMSASVLATAVHVKSAANLGHFWSVGAGFSDQGAILDDVISIKVPTPMKVRDKLMSEANINVITYQAGVGYYLSGNETQFVEDDNVTYPSVFTSLFISKVINVIRRNVERISKNYLYKPNNSMTWSQWVGSVSAYLDSLVVGNGIDRYKVIMDETTVSEEDIKNHTAPGIIYIKPLRVIEYIPIKLAITEDSFYFETEGEV